MLFAQKEVSLANGADRLDKLISHIQNSCCLRKLSDQKNKLHINIVCHAVVPKSELQAIIFSTTFVSC